MFTVCRLDLLKLSKFDIGSELWYPFAWFEVWFYIFWPPMIFVLWFLIFILLPLMFQCMFNAKVRLYHDHPWCSFVVCYYFRISHKSLRSGSEQARFPIWFLYVMFYWVQLTSRPLSSIHYIPPNSSCEPHFWANSDDSNRSFI